MLINIICILYNIVHRSVLTLQKYYSHKYSIRLIIGAVISLRRNLSSLDPNANHPFTFHSVIVEIVLRFYSTI